MSFPCTKCGLCCIHIDKVEQLAHYHSGDGICMHYDPQIGCKIYQDRPIICKIDEGYEQFFSTLMSLQKYYKVNADACNQLQIEHQLDKKFRIINDNTKRI